MVTIVPQLLGKTAIVSGVNEAIGASIAQVFADQGARVHAIAENHSVLLSRVGPKRVDTGAITPIAISHADSEAVRSAINSIGYREIVDILVCTSEIDWRAWAGTTYSGADEIEKFNLPTHAMRSMLQISLPFLRASRGIVVLVGAPPVSQHSSLGGAQHQQGSRAFADFASAISLKERERGVRITTVLPGFTSAASPQDVLKPAGQSETWMLQPEDTARVCLFAVTLPAHAHIPELSIVPARVPKADTAAPVSENDFSVSS